MNPAMTMYRGCSGSAAAKAYMYDISFRLA